MGILELLYANPEEPLSENQLAMVASAEASGKGLIDTINNIIDLAKLDPENNISSSSGGESDPVPHLSESLLEEVDIRDLCEQVAGSMAKACADKNLVVLPSWTKPSLASLSTSVPSSAPVSASSVHSSRTNPVQCKNTRGIPSPDESVNGYTSSTDSQHGFTGRRFQADRKAVLELMVAMDEPDKDPDQDTHWNFKLNVSVMTRILTQVSNMNEACLLCYDPLCFIFLTCLHLSLFSWWKMQSSSRAQASWKFLLYLHHLDPSL